MKILHSRTCFAFLRNVVVALAISLSVPGWAQQTAAPEIPKEGQLKLAPEPPKGAQSTAAPKATSAFEAARSAMQTILPEINIPAGQHLRGVVELLSDKTGANIVLDESLQGLKLPALKLRNVTITSVLDTIRTILKGEVAVSYSEDRGPGASVVIVYPNRRGEIRKPTKICRVFRLADPVSNALIGGRSRYTLNTPKSFPADKTEEEKEAIRRENRKTALIELVEQISEATRQACSALTLANGQKRENADDYPQIEVNLATQLLIVTGDEADVDLVGQIISGVGGTSIGSVKATITKDGPTRPGGGQADPGEVNAVGGGQARSSSGGGSSSGGSSGGSSSGGGANPGGAVALRFVTADDAFTAIQQKLGAKAAEAVSGVDDKGNTIALNPDHSQAAIVRAFLTGFDRRPPDLGR